VVWEWGRERKEREEDAQVYVVSEVDPGREEDAKVGDYDWRVDVVEDFGRLVASMLVSG